MRLLVALLFTAAVLGRAAAAVPGAPMGTPQEHYQAGLKHYNLSEWEPALREFRDAYFLKPDPALLFNIGQCQRQLGDFEGAAKSYRAYLREAQDVPEERREQVRGLVQQMEKAVAESRAKQPPTGIVDPNPVVAPASPPVTATTEPATTVTAGAPPAKVPLYKKWWLWTAVGGAVAIGLGVGLGAGLSSHSTNYPSAGPANATFTF